MGTPVNSRLTVRKNRLMRRWLRILREIGKAVLLVFVAGLLGVAMVFGYSYVITASCFALDKTVVRGLHRLSEPDIVRLAGLEKGKNVLMLNLSETEAKIRSHPWVKEAFVGRELPDRIVIEVVEREGAGVVVIGEVPYMMDTGGEVFKRYEKGDLPDTPVFTGIMDGNARKKTRLVHESLEVLRVIRSGGTSIPGGMVSEIHGDDRWGVTLFSRAGYSIRLGFGDYERSLKRAVAVIGDYRGRGDSVGGIHLDCSNRDEIVVQKVRGIREREMDRRNSWET
ncbi:MAG TPA: FtsQ-type POTRA domain-containing protein [Syntrophales bacterium]|nr:FtsQ-type POTRA domain-containing protein [Syntrophales bacterium]HPX11652.1 FtsQ-type POTRA domain-containing protein [Syntrophales bacterium]HQN76842.1 FtsQ-type POTRA domain-containing protein [Syntrophales bacterium]HQQ26664.1 FtsQ-type POTRA domain-containing protein [Syntrophales bacterium]